MIFNHLLGNKSVNANQTSGRAPKENDDDVVVVSALRTPICKSRRGNLKVICLVF